MSVSAHATPAPAFPDEDARVALLQRLNLLDTPPEETFDRVTRLASIIAGTPMAMVTLVDNERQWFKSSVGIESKHTPRDIGFCPHAMVSDDLFVVPDAENDPRFQHNPLVTDSPHIRFYAGMPLRSSQGHALGTLCVIDTKARQLTSEQEEALRDLAAIVRRELLQREATVMSQSMQRAEGRALEESSAVLHATFHQAAVGMVVLGMDGRLQQLNQRFASMLGYTVEQLQGKHFSEFTDADDVALAAADTARMQSGAISSYSRERRYRRRNGEYVWVNVTVALARTSDTQPLHYISVVEDISERKRSDDALAELRAELEARVEQRTAELKAVNTDLAHVVAERNRTIAARRLIEEALRTSRETLQTITDNLPVLIGDIDVDLRYRFTNATYGEVFHCDASQLPGRRVADVVRPDLMARLAPMLERVLAGERVVNENVVYDEASGRVWSATYIPHYKHDVINGFYVVSYDVTERKRLESSLTEQALQDPLTLLPNRRALLAHVSDAIADSAPLAILFLDLDGFKRVNDLYGHESGDVLLTRVADRLRATVRASDVVSRLAGDEFVLVLHALNTHHLVAADARRVASGLIEALNVPVDIGTHQVRIGASIGIAYYTGRPTRPITAKGLLTCADLAMYEAKASGKNTVRLANEDRVLAHAPRTHDETAG
ncbi:diguanylate cyclase (GGDEF)-like protein/PAS domain S-box-containing protein [Robbsia andropogonis]|uniref:sensor domain-containing diguanylate cyclase n=1 Tax=Robbsia andropogonis TaxID=28092 RepID=UPI003D1A07C9